MSKVLEIFRDWNALPGFGGKKWNLPAVDGYTQRNWFDGKFLPRSRSAGLVAAGVWTQMHAQGKAELRKNVLAIITRHVPTAPVATWQDKTAFAAWFFALAEDIPEEVAGSESASLDLLRRDPTSGEFHSVSLHPELLPVHKGDQLQIKVKLPKAGFVRLIWLDQHGEPFAMHNWPDGALNFQPIGPARELVVPAQLTAGGESTLTAEGPQGLETLLLLVNYKGSAEELPNALRKASHVSAPPVSNPPVTTPTFSAFPAPRIKMRSPSILVHADPVRRFHDTLAAKLATDCDQLMLLSFPNAGQG